MSQPIISIEALSKAFRIGVEEEVPDTLVGAALQFVKSPWQNLRRLRRLNTFSEHNANGETQNKSVEQDLIWALREVSFEVTEGEVVGIIGKNGAGKSTLLKLLSRITEPTSGRAVIRGRVSSLLEVGTGFHPELTGRENVYMNGTLLGMTKQEIDRKFDEIVQFSGVERFLDTPVKRYSSGMQVRLAFAVAAHLEPEILIVDEVLAVGDAQFQKQCMGKMKDAAMGGRTVLFVSHNMAALQNLCPRTVLLTAGEVCKDGPTAEVISHYISSTIETRGFIDLTDPAIPRRGSGEARFTWAELLSQDSLRVDSLQMGESFKVRMGVMADYHIPAAAMIVVLYDQHGRRICGLNSHDVSNWSVALEPNVEQVVECTVLQPNLMPGTYYIHLQIKGDRHGVVDTVINGLTVEVTPADIYETGRIPVGEATLFLHADWACQNPAVVQR